MKVWMRALVEKESDFEVKTASRTDVVDMLFNGEVALENPSEIRLEVVGSEVLSVKAKFVSGFGVGFEANNSSVSFVLVMF